MNAAALELDESHVNQEIGDVVATEGGKLRVGTTRGTYDARRAFSCLVEPAEGDRVLVAVSDAGAAWVLAVLERTADGPTVLRNEGDLQLRVDEGRLSLSATEGVDVVTPQTLKLLGKAVEMTAREGKAVIDKLALFGEEGHLDVKRVKGFFDLFDSVAERVSQRVQRSYRFVEELDVTRAKQVDVRAEDNVSVRGKNTLVSAELLVKMDAEQIHLG